MPKKSTGGAMFPKAAAFAANTMGSPGTGKGAETGAEGLALDTLLDNLRGMVKRQEVRR